MGAEMKWVKAFTLNIVALVLAAGIGLVASRND